MSEENNKEHNKWWRYPRFFATMDGETAIITGKDYLHATSVLRMKAGDLAVVSCDGTDYLCKMTTDDHSSASFAVQDRQQNQAEPPFHVRLFQCCPKREKLEIITNQAVQLGISEIIPVISRRCVSRPDKPAQAKQRERCQKIAYEAAKQCGRGTVPQIGDFLMFHDAANSINADHLGIICYECGGLRLNEIFAANAHANVINVMIGSEGGFDPDEAAYAVSRGWRAASLGARILRCETAPVTALSIIMNLMGDI
jgi:16S rRNA (uracil1498-N3)-methyltransferase